MKYNQGWIALALGVSALASCAPAGIVVGTGAVVARSVAQERTTMNALRDTEIQISLNNRFLNHSKRLFADVSTNVTEGRVVLTGSVPTREDKITATSLGWQTPGVVEVTDELVVEEDAGAVAYVEDAWISNQLRFKLLTDGTVSSINYNVETVGKTVHLTGLARSRTELSKVIEYATAVSGVSRVVSHVLTIDDPRRQITAAESPKTG